MAAVHSRSENIQRKEHFLYNGEKLWEGDELDGHPLLYDKDERDSWQVIIVLPGVEIIPAYTFYDCEDLEKVIMADTVRRIENEVFQECHSLVYVKLSRNLEYIGRYVFCGCFSLPSIFIPPSCGEIGAYAFSSCRKLLILGLPQHTHLDVGALQDTLLIKKSPLDVYENGNYDYDQEEEVIRWIQALNNEEEYALHRACSSFNPLAEIIHALVNRQGIKAMKIKNAIGITPSQYLAANTFTDLSEEEIINRYILDMIGEV